MSFDIQSKHHSIFNEEAWQSAPSRPVRVVERGQLLRLHIFQRYIPVFVLAESFLINFQALDSKSFPFDALGITIHSMPTPVVPEATRGRFNFKRGQPQQEECPRHLFGVHPDNAHRGPRSLPGSLTSQIHTASSCVPRPS